MNISLRSCLQKEKINSVVSWPMRQLSTILLVSLMVRNHVLLFIINYHIIPVLILRGKLMKVYEMNYFTLKWELSLFITNIVWNINNLLGHDFRHQGCSPSSHPRTCVWFCIEVNNHIHIKIYFNLIYDSGITYLDGYF